MYVISFQAIVCPMSRRVERSAYRTTVDLLKQRKLKLFEYIFTMKDKWVKMVMLRAVEGDWPRRKSARRLSRDITL